jgi:6-phosphogluconolactonase (cycloisomerase 2 family)
VDVTKSGGQQPVSVGLRGDVLIVTNKSDQAPSDTAGDRPNYTSFRIRKDGNLKLLKGSTVETGPGDSPTQSLISRDGKFLFGDNFLAHPIPEVFPGSSQFVPPYGSELVSFRIGPNGELTPAMAPLSSPLPDTADQYILGLAAHPTQNIVYTGFVVGNKLGVFTYDNSGKLTFNHAIPLTGAGICWIVISPDAKRMYATNFATNSVAVFNIEDPLNPVEIQDVVLSGPKPAHPPPLPPFKTVSFQLDLDPSGDCLYVLNHEQDPDNNFPGGNRIAVLKVLPDGRLQEVTHSPVVLPQEFEPAAAHPQGIVAL